MTIRALAFAVATLVSQSGNQRASMMAANEGGSAGSGFDIRYPPGRVLAKANDQIQSSTRNV